MKFLMLVFIFLIPGLVEASEIEGHRAQPPKEMSLGDRCASILETLKSGSSLPEFEHTIKSLDDSEIQKAAHFLVEGLRSKLESSRFSHPQYLANEFMQDWDQPIFDLVLEVSKQQTGLSLNRNKESLEKVRTVFFGMQNVSALTTELQKKLTVGKPSSVSHFLGLSKNYKVSVTEIANKIKGCKQSIALCKIEFPEISRQLNEEYILLRVTQSTIAERKSVLEVATQNSMGENVFVATFTKEIQKLKALQMQVVMMIDALSPIIGKVSEVKELADGVSDIEIMKSVISASRQGIDLDFLMDSENGIDGPRSSQLDPEDQKIYDHMLFLLESPASLESVLGVLESYVESTSVPVMVFMKMIPVLNKDSIAKDNEAMQSIAFPESIFYSIKSPHSRSNSKFGYSDVILFKMLKRLIPGAHGALSKEEAQEIARKLFNTKKWSNVPKLEMFAVEKILQQVSNKRPRPRFKMGSEEQIHFDRMMEVLKLPVSPAARLELLDSYLENKRIPVAVLREMISYLDELTLVVQKENYSFQIHAAPTVFFAPHDSSKNLKFSLAQIILFKMLTQVSFGSGPNLTKNQAREIIIEILADKKWQDKPGLEKFTVNRIESLLAPR